MQPLSRLDERDVGVQPVCGHLIIGLGGVGRRTIGELRRTLDKPFGRRQPRGFPAHYLIIDLEEALDGGVALETSLGLGDDLPVFALDMASVRNYAAQLPDEVRDWLSRYDAATEIGSDTVANPRRLGSLLLAAKAAQLQEWLTLHISGLLDGHSQGILQVHVLGYFAGGIGGGALTQLLAQLRLNDALRGRGRIQVYGLLPASGAFSLNDEDPTASVNTGALLSELASAQPRRPARQESSEQTDLGFQRLCDEIVVISTPAETGRVVHDVRALPEALAMTVRQRLFLADEAIAPPGDAETRFGQSIIAAAPKILTTATDEIEEALSLSLLQSGLCQIVHAHWQSGRGYLPESRRVDYDHYVRKSDVQARWLLTVEHLIQSSPILDADIADSQWRLLADDWKIAIERFMAEAEAEPRRQWLHCVTELWKKRFGDGFRGQGVISFFRSRQNVRRDMARSIRQRVEMELLGAWQEGEWGLADLKAIIDALIALQRERITSIDDRIANTRMAEEACRVRAVAAYEQWSHLPFWRMKGAKIRSLMHVYCIHLHELYVNRTRAEGWLFAKTLLPVVIEELENLSQLLDHMVASFQQGSHTVDLLLDGLSLRMEDEEENASFAVRLLNRDQLRQLVHDIRVNESVQSSQALALRRELIRQCGTGAGIRGVCAWTEKKRWLAPLAQLCREQIVSPNGPWSDVLGELLNASIYDVLQARCGDNFALLRDLGARYLDQIEALMPDMAEKRLKTRLYILLPRDPTKEAFIRTLKSALAFSRRMDIRFLETDDHCGSIHMLSVTAPFAVSDVELLRQMDAKYRSYIQYDRDYAMMALHSFGNQADWQDEYMLGDDHKPTAWTAALLLTGFPLRLVVERLAADNSRRSRVWLVPRDEHGFEDEPIIIADDILTAPQHVYGPLASLLEDNVLRALARGDGGQPAGEQERVINQIIEKVLEIRGRCNDDPMDPVYRSFVEAGKTALTLIRNHWGKGANDV